MNTITLSFSPCPNDTFLMYALIHQSIDLRGFHFDVQFLDIESLNKEALKGTFDITKVSAAILPHIQAKYSLLQSGAAFGLEGGPLLIARPGKELHENSVIAIPGEHTSAHALFQRYYKKPCKKSFVIFSDIFDLLSSGDADAGVIIHEDRFTYKDKGFVCIDDLGVKWINETGLPVPLGLFVAKNSFDSEMIQTLSLLFTQSIEYAWMHYDEVFIWVEKHSQNKNPDIIRKHIEYYVNKFSLNLEAEGIGAIELLTALNFESDE